MSSGHSPNRRASLSEHRLPAPPPDSLANAGFVEVIIGCTVGSFVQYYDFYALYYFEAEIKEAYFPASMSSSDAGIILYIIPYLIRPFAGLFFGHWSDRYGRRDALMITTFGMGIPSVLLGCIPKYKYIGYWSVAFVLILRLAQTFFVSGEYSNAVLYIYEQTGRESNYALAQALMWMGSTGSLLAVVWKVSLDHYVDIDVWLFRLPFFATFFLMWIVYFFRVRLPVDRINDRLQRPVRYVFVNIKTFWHTIIILTVTLISPLVAHSASFYWLPDYLLKHHDPSDSFAFYGIIVSMLVSLSVMCAVGHFADLYDALYKRVRVSVLLNLVMMIVLPLLMLAIADTSNETALTIEQCVFCTVALSCIPSTLAWVVGFVEDQNVRGTILSFTYNTSEVVGAGYLPYILYAGFDDRVGTIWAAGLAGLIVGIFAAISAFAMLLGTKFHYKSKEVAYDEISSSDDDSDEKSDFGL